MRTIPRLQLKRMNKKDRYQYIIDYFKEEMPKVTTELEFGSVFQLLVAVVLSAQCTDKRVNSITPLKVESELMANIPAEYATDAHHWLLLHGRYVCTSRKPHCEKCPFDHFCPKIMDGSKL